MYCPNCGANNTTEQNFCRSCGLNLETIARSLLEQIPSAESASLMRKQKNLEKIGSVGLNGLCAVGLVGVGALIYSVLIKFILSGTNIAGGILLIAFFVFAVMLLAYVIYMKSLDENRKLLQLSKRMTPLDDVTTARLLEEKPFEPARSVVENSTELLPIENKTRKFE